MANKQLKTTNRIYKVELRRRQRGCGGGRWDGPAEVIYDRFEAIILHAERRPSGAIEVTYQPLGSGTGLHGFCVVGPAGERWNGVMDKPSEWGPTFTRTDRTYQPQPHVQPTSGNRAYDLVH